MGRPGGQLGILFPPDLSLIPLYKEPCEGVFSPSEVQLMRQGKRATYTEGPSSTVPHQGLHFFAQKRNIKRRISLGHGTHCQQVQSCRERSKVVRPPLPFYRAGDSSDFRSFLHRRQKSSPSSPMTSLATSSGHWVQGAEDEGSCKGATLDYIAHTNLPSLLQNWWPSE